MPAAANSPTIMGYMGWSPPDQHGWTNMHLSRDLASIHDAHRLYNWSSLYDDLPSTVVSRHGKAPAAGWESALAKLAHDIFLPGLASGALNGVFIGDEICCGVPECWPQLAVIATELRKLLGPRATLYLNECASPTEWNFTGTVPAALDYISIDLYRGNGIAEVHYARAFIEQYVFPRMLPHQKLLLVPGTFACRNTTRTGAFPISYYSNRTVEALNGFYDWAKSDARIGGLIPWHF
jgi:hypothetical protein